MWQSHDVFGPFKGQNVTEAVVNTRWELTWKMIGGKKCVEARLVAEELDYDPHLDEEVLTPEEVYSRGFPYPLADSIRVLGVLIDRFLHFDDQNPIF